MGCSAKRVCIVGLDGVGLNNILNFLNAAALNGVSSIINKGYVSSFISLPPYTPSAWTSIFTGVNPGKHGVYCFFKVSRSDGFKVSPTSSYDVMYPRIFEMLNMYNLRSVVINAPLVYPVHGLVGLENLVVVSDWASPKQFIHPKQYEEKYREYLIEPPHEWWIVRNNVKSYVRFVEVFLGKRIDLYYELLEGEEFNLFIVVFSELDWLMHRIPDIVAGKQLNLAYKVLSLIDRFIRRAREICDLVILVSDHGFKTSRIVLSVNSILASNDMITFKSRFNIGKLLRLKVQNVALFTNDDTRGFSSIPSIIFRNLFTLVKKIVMNHSSCRLGSIISVLTNIDYPRSKAFMIEPDSWGIYVDGGYLDVVRRIFSNIRFVRGVLRKEEVFWGPYVEGAPDLILIPQDYVSFDVLMRTEPMYLSCTGDHEPHALVAFHGDDVLPTNSVGNEIRASIYDLVPTILAYMGLPIPGNTDGKPLIDVFTVELPNTNKKANYSQKFKLLRKLQKVVAKRLQPVTELNTLMHIPYLNPY